MSHSRELNRGSTVTSKKSFRANVNGGTFVAKAPYNDVYGGPPEFGVSSLSPCPEDYREIFGSFHVSRASSIPTLDLPALDEKEVFFDVRSSGFDYAEVFGGFDCLDFAATDEDLTKQSNEGDGDSSEEAWTPAGTESLSDDSDHSTKIQSMLNRDSDLSFDRCTEFKISYNQAYQSGKEDMSNGITHVTQVNEVPGFTYLVDGVDFQGQDDENHPFHVNDDGYFNIDLGMGLNESKPAKKKASQPPNAIYERQNFENGPQTPKGRDKSSSCLDESFITISEINLRTEPSQVPPPSRLPPIIGVKKLYSKLNSNSNYVFPEGSSDDSSPPYFDVEVDASSSAAASAAAMKEVMEKARAKLLSAKELMERKKEGVHNRTKKHFKYDMKDKEASVSKLLERSNNGDDEKGQDTCEIDDNEMTFSVTDEMRKDTQTNKEVQVSLKREKLLKVAHKFAENKFKDDDIDDSREWKEAVGFFEVKSDNSRKAPELVKNENISGRNVKTEKDVVIEALEPFGENDNEVDAVLNVQGLKKMREAEGKNWQEDNNMRSKPATVQNSQREYERPEGTLCNYDLKENEKKSEITHLPVEKKGSREADKPVKYEVLVEVKHDDNGGEVEQTITEVNGKRKSKVINGGNDNDSKLKEISVVRENELGEIEGIQHLEMEGKLIESSTCEKRLKKIRGQNENERSTEDTLERLNTEKRLEDDLQEGNEAIPPKKPSEKEVGKRLKDDEEYEKKLQDIHERWENILTKHKKHPKEKDCRKELEEINNREPSEMEIKEAVQQDKIEATEDNASKYKEFVRMFEDHERGELKKIKSADRAQVQIEMEPSKVCNEVCEVDNEYQAMQQHCKHDRCRERVEATQGFLGQIESGDKMGEHKINKIQLDSAGMMLLESAEDVNAFYRGEEVFIDLDWQARPEDVDKSLSVDDSGNKGIDISCEMKYCDIETDRAVPPIAKNIMDSGISCMFEVHVDDQIKMKEAKNVLTQDESEKKGKEVGVSNGDQHLVKMNNVPKVVSDPEHQDSKSDRERGEQGKALNLKENKEKFVSTHVVKERDEKESKCEANESHISEGKENTPNLASEVNAGQFIARKDKIMNDTLLVGDRETERTKKKQELENDRLRMEEEKEREREREREREKDRMIIDRTILEGRKENTEGHAEKAAMEIAIAEAQRKAMLEARERLEKACADAREKTLTGKAALEARVRAERAAVDRANAEARESAFEKAMDEKSVFESRERIERSFSEKLSASSRGTVIRQSSSFNDMPDLQFQRTDTSSGSRYTYSSSNGEVSGGVNGESAQRCKARLERHRRTAERAAKALAEKNMRDILAQREQVERKRLAETLDADVRRWSSGKEGNLRALLSTLQYILWPDSGWQPVPLTEVITAAAVKKAYRKATLCVHPDKLQQRGASIPQKYICEKVFDLLKDAWNKFNSEER